MRLAFAHPSHLRRRCVRQVEGGMEFPRLREGMIVHLFNVKATSNEAARSGLKTIGSGAG